MGEYLWWCTETAQFLRDISEVEGVQIYDVEIEYIIMEANRSREDNLGPVEQDGQMPTYKTLIKHCIYPEQFGLGQSFMHGVWRLLLIVILCRVCFLSL